MNPSVPSLIREYKYKEAFWAAAEDVMTDAESQQYFLSIANTVQRIVNLRDDTEKIHQLAKAGNPYMAFAYGRLHQLLAWESDSALTAQRYYIDAGEEGLPDGIACNAFLEASGALGEKDENLYHTLLRESLDKGSRKAMIMRLSDIIYGEHGTKKDPDAAIAMIEKFMADSTAAATDAPFVDLLYEWLGFAYKEKGDEEQAKAYYEEASRRGVNSAFYYLAMLVLNSEDSKDYLNFELYEQLTLKALEANDPQGYLLNYLVLDYIDLDRLDDERKETICKLAVEDLEMAEYYGESLAALFLGWIYEEGQYGEEKDYEKAFRHYAKGATLDDGTCYAALARMILTDHTAPQKYDEEFGYECAYKAMLQGDEDSLTTAIKGYKNGYLTHHAAAIEQFYLPKYEQCMASKEEGFEQFMQSVEEEEARAAEKEEDTESGNEGKSSAGDLYSELCLYSNEATEENLNLGVDMLWENVKRAKSLLSHDNCNYISVDEEGRECVCLVADYAKSFIKIAGWLNNYEHLANALYRPINMMLELIAEHPRLKLMLLNIQLSVLRDIEIQSNAPYELSITEEVEKEMDDLSKCIALADAGKLDEIPQSGALKRDPVEWTREWERAIDDADREVYSHLNGIPRGMGWCFQFWYERKAALEKRGVTWRSPSVMNPGVMFD